MSGEKKNPVVNFFFARASHGQKNSSRSQMYAPHILAITQFSRQNIFRALQKAFSTNDLFFSLFLHFRSVHTIWWQRKTKQWRILERHDWS